MFRIVFDNFFDIVMYLQKLNFCYSYLSIDISLVLLLHSRSCTTTLDLFCYEVDVLVEVRSQREDLSIICTFLF